MLFKKNDSAYLSDIKSGWYNVLLASSVHYHSNFLPIMATWTEPSLLFRRWTGSKSSSSSDVDSSNQFLDVIARIFLDFWCFLFPLGFLLRRWSDKFERQTRAKCTFSLSAFPEIQRYCSTLVCSVTIFAPTSETGKVFLCFDLHNA